MRAVRVYVQRVLLLRELGNLTGYSVNHVLFLHGVVELWILRRVRDGRVRFVLFLRPRHLRKRQDRLSEGEGFLVRDTTCVECLYDTIVRLEVVSIITPVRDDVA